MKIHSICLTAILAISTVGCGPKPVAEDGANRPAVDVTVDPDSSATALPSRETDADTTGVDVQVGGGQGVQVDVDGD